MFKYYEIEEKKRARLLRDLTGPTRLREVSGEPKIVDWAPPWWTGDEDATTANFAAMNALRRK